jgi:hypothetical protein
MEALMKKDETPFITKIDGILTFWESKDRMKLMMVFWVSAGGLLAWMLMYFFAGLFSISHHACMTKLSAAFSLQAIN